MVWGLWPRLPPRRGPRATSRPKPNHGADMPATIHKLASAVLTATAVLLALLMLAPALFGYARYTILTGSMAGTYDPGSVVYAKPVPTAQLRVGDVITYAPPASSGASGLVTHRIFSIAPGPHGGRTFRTKGDANRRADPWRFKLDQPTQARVGFGVPYVGRLLIALSDRGTRMLFVGLPALMIAIGVVIALVRDARRERVGSLEQA